MMRIELYVDKNDRLTADIYPLTKSEYMVGQPKGKDCYQLIKDCCSSNIISITSNNEDIRLMSNGFVLTVNEAKKVFKKNGTKVIRDTINDFYAKEKLKEVPKKKVQRKNKYTGKKIIAGLIAATVLSTIAITTVEGKKNEFIDQTTSYYSQTEEIHDDGIYIIESNENKKEEETIMEETIIEETEPETYENATFVSLNYEDNYNSEKAQKTRAYYSDAIKKYSEIYGVDYELMIAIATQERGVHSEVRDSGGAIGLFQIENIWNNEKLTAYNYETKEYETITVDENSLSDVYYNIKVGCMVFQTALRNRKYNIPLAITEYNMGCGNVDRILQACSEATGKTVQEIVNDSTNLDWMEFRYKAIGGDKQYLEHVSSYLKQNTEINVYNGEEEINMNIKRK